MSDSALIKLVNGPARLPVATLVIRRRSTPATGSWPSTYQLGHSVSVGVISYPRRHFEVEEGYWQHLIQTDASIIYSLGLPLLMLDL